MKRNAVKIGIFLAAVIFAAFVLISLAEKSRAEEQNAETRPVEPDILLLEEAPAPINRVKEPEIAHILTRERDERPDERRDDETQNEQEGALFQARDDIPLAPDLQEYAAIVCEEYGVELPVFFAIMETESNFNPDAVSATDDYGLMQINSICAEYLRENLGITDLLDPRQNMKAAAFLLGDLYAKHGETNLVLMCYQYGEGGAAVLWEEGIYYTQYYGIIIERKLKY